MSMKYWFAGLALLCGAASLQAQQPEQRPLRVVSVSGTGVVQRQPDRAVVMIAVESRASAAQAAAQTNARKMDAVFAALRKLGVVSPNVQTVSYALQPEYRQPDPRSVDPNSPIVTGYVASNMVRVTLDSLQRVGAVIDATIAAGANRIDGLSFELRDPQAARLEALRIAVEHARTEAQTMADAAGQKLGVPQSMSSSSSYNPQPMYRMAADVALAVAPPPTPVEPGNLSISANVSITFLLEDK
jgi:uncharacterized protein YggE